jgi:hypothetical protein
MCIEFILQHHFSTFECSLIKTRYYENETSDCFRVVPANVFVILYSFIAIIKLALSSFVLTPNALFHSVYSATAPSRHLSPSKDASIFLSLLLVSTILVFLGSVTWPSGPRPPFLFVFFSLEFGYEELLAKQQ